MCALSSSGSAGNAVQPCPKARGSLTVCVVHAEDGSPFGGVAVSVSGPTPGSGTSDNAHGAKAFDAVKPGTYTAEAKLSAAQEKDYDPPAPGRTSVASGGDGLITIPVKRKRIVVAAAPVLHWIEFRIVWDDTGEPLAGVPLVLVAPDGTRTRASTDARGLVRLDAIKRGTCELQTELEQLTRAGAVVFAGTGPVTAPEPPERREPPREGWRLLNVDLWKVTRADSIALLAGRCRVHWKDLARLNFGTDKPAHINRCLARDVGCTHRTADGHNYRFDDSDEPGLMILPRPYVRAGFATFETHTLRVLPLPPVAPWAFSL